MSTAPSRLANELIVAATETANQSDVHTRDSFPLAVMNETLFPPQAVLPLEDGGFIYFIFLFFFWRKYPCTRDSTATPAHRTFSPAANEDYFLLLVFSAIGLSS